MAELCQTPEDLTHLLVDDTLEIIFSYLNLTDLVSAGQVNRRWRYLAKDATLWKHRCIVRKNDADDKQILRVLSFAPCLDTFDSELCMLGSLKDIENDSCVPTPLEQKMMDTGCQIRALHVFDPSTAFMERFGPSLEELSLATSERDVLTLVESLSCKLISLRWLSEHDSDCLYLPDNVLLSIIKKHKNSLKCLYGLQNVQSVRCFPKESMETIANCTNLHALWIPLNPSMKLLMNLQHLKKLVLEVYYNHHFLPDIAVPHCVEELSLKILQCPLGGEEFLHISNQCATLTSLKTITIRPYEFECSPMYRDCNCHAFRRLLPGVIIKCYCFKCRIKYWDGAIPSEDEGYEYIYENNDTSSSDDENDTSTWEEN